MNRDVFLSLLSFFESFCEGLVLILYYLVISSNKVIWAWTFICRKTSDC
jgi:hypothetical protein